MADFLGRNKNGNLGWTDRVLTVETLKTQVE